MEAVSPATERITMIDEEGRNGPRYRSEQPVACGAEAAVQYATELGL